LDPTYRCEEAMLIIMIFTHFINLSHVP